MGPAPCASRKAREAAIATLLARARRARFAIYCGRGALGALFAPPEQCLLVIGPPRSGKTSAIVVPNLCSAAGPVVCLSTKRDVLEVTAATRGRVGECLLFDPSDTTPAPKGVRRVAWSPLDAAGVWDRAVLGAEAMVGASRGARGAAASHWSERAGALLASALHGAALAGCSMAELVASIHRREGQRWLEVLATHEALVARDLLLGILETDAREQSGIWSTASGLLAAYRTSGAQRSAEGERLDPRAFVTASSTLYVVAGAEAQEHVAPIVAGLLRDLRSAAYDLFASGAGRDHPPLLLVLDELANIAPLHDLPVLVAEGASQGVLTLACLQDLSQARRRWGAAAEGFLSLFGAKIILGGLVEASTLEALSLLAGESEVESLALSGSRRRSRQYSRSTRRLRRLAPDAVARPPSGRALTIFGATPGWVELTPYFADPLLAAALSPTGERAHEAGRD